MTKRILLMAAAAASAAAFGASTVRLVYGGDWNPAGKSVRRTVESPKFGSLAKGRYVVECIEENGDMKPENLGSWKLPCAFLISEGGNCYFVLDNVPAGISAEKLVETFNRADDIRVAAEKKGFETAEDCGSFLFKMERYVGGPRRIVSKGFYPEVFEKLKKLDPEDSTGWQRHFTLGLEHDKNTKADGLELVIKANWFREKAAEARKKGDAAEAAKKMEEGLAFIEAEKAKPRAKLTKEQKQGILMAQFALQREDASKKEELDNILQKVAAYDETTLWGTAALGWLNIRGKPPLSAYWGWHDGDFKGSQFAKRVKYGIDHSFPKEGRYTVRFVSEGGTPLKVDSIALFTGSGKTEKEVVSLKDPEVDGKTTTFTCKLPRAYRGKLTSMLVRGDAPPTGESSGRIVIERQVLRPRKEAK